MSWVASEVVALEIAVGHHDINAVPFGVSVSKYVTLHCGTFCPGLERRRAGRLRSHATAAV